MTQQGPQAEAKIGLQDANPATQQLRLVQLLVAQADGTFATVDVEPGLVISAATNKPMTPMSSEQANTIIRLLERMCDKLDELHEDLT